jgi:hypothetical protein
MNRNVITGYNDEWIMGFREEQVGDQWVRSLHSDWVFAILDHHHEAWQNKQPEVELPELTDEFLEKVRDNTQAFTALMREAIRDPDVLDALGEAERGQGFTPTPSNPQLEDRIECAPGELVTAHIDYIIGKLNA